MNTRLLIVLSLSLTLLSGCIKEIKEVRLDRPDKTLEDITPVQPSECSQALVESNV
jgi:hypothetical protein